MRRCRTFGCWVSTCAAAWASFGAASTALAQPAASSAPAATAPVPPASPQATAGPPAPSSSADAAAPPASPETGTGQPPDSTAPVAGSDSTHPPTGPSTTASAPTAPTLLTPPPAPAPAAPPPRRDSGPPTLLGPKPALGGFGGLKAAYTRFHRENGAIIGLEAALLLDHRLSIGFAGYGWVNETVGPADPWDGSRRWLTLGYGGAVLRYSFLSRLPVYAAVGALVGGGVVGLVPVAMRDHEESMSRDDVDTFFVFEPQVTGYANLTRWMRFMAEVGYRVSAGVGDELEGLSLTKRDVNGVTLGGGLQFGWF